VEAGVEQEAGSQLHAQQTQLLILSRLQIDKKLDCIQAFDFF
jgi:hypothetical protein